MACPTGAAASAPNWQLQYEVVASGTVSSLWADADTAQAGSGTIVTVSRNGLTTAGNFISCTVSPTSTNGSTTACEQSGSIAVTAGDELTVRVAKQTSGSDAGWKTYVTLTQ